jgi:phosphoribosylanthranilate isomerase
MIVKVCGMRKAVNIREISDLGVDWLGLIFWSESPRNVQQVASRGGFIPDYTPIKGERPELGVNKWLAPRENNPKRVGVFVDDMPQTIVTRVFNFNLDFVQLHGEELPVMIENLRRTLEPDIRQGVKIIKTIPVETEADFARCEDYKDVVDYFLFHNKCKEKGGSGEKFDWNILQAYKCDVPFVLSGGIGPDDAPLIKAIQHPQLKAVDINSRFETEVGVKDVALVKKFMEELKG